MFAKLYQKEKELSEQLAKVRKAIQSLQVICDHKWIDDGHDSHHNYEKCTICSKRQRD